MKKSTPANGRGKAAKFPLSIHRARGYWMKKISGKQHYFKKVADDPRGAESLKEYHRLLENIDAGRPADYQPQDDTGKLTLNALCNHYTQAKNQQVELGDLSPRTFRDVLGTCRILQEAFGGPRLVSDLGPADFSRLATSLKKNNRLGAIAFGNVVLRSRSAFKYAVDHGLLDRAPIYGIHFAKPKPKVLAKEKKQRPARRFDPAEIHILLDAANKQMRTMILLALNCGFGPEDLRLLKESDIDLESGWMDYDRTKTGEERRAKLWPETIAAIKGWMADRPARCKPEAEGYLFRTVRGALWGDGNRQSPITQAFRTLTEEIDAAEVKEAATRRRKPKPPINRKGVGLYAMRHCLYTAGENLTGDLVACKAIMGHRDNSMQGRYREGVYDQRIERVCSAVRDWLFGDATEGAAA